VACRQPEVIQKRASKSSGLGLGSEFDATEFPEVDIHHSLAELPGDHLNGGCKSDPSDLLDVAPQLVSAGNPHSASSVDNR
jgi:hypothetical protein